MQTGYAPWTRLFIALSSAGSLTLSFALSRMCPEYRSAFPSGAQSVELSFSSSPRALLIFGSIAWSTSPCHLGISSRSLIRSSASSTIACSTAARCILGGWAPFSTNCIWSISTNDCWSWDSSGSTCWIRSRVARSRFASVSTYSFRALRRRLEWPFLTEPRSSFQSGRSVSLRKTKRSYGVAIFFSLNSGWRAFTLAFRHRSAAVTACLRRSVFFSSRIPCVSSMYLHISPFAFTCIALE
mmetsp:Transcript_17950/g.43944  ORF Transcript_17950/g.43944 Transcript_17950/m.43944 type:complete len:241 (+) Transcript_17950:291-1013(+)